MRLHVVCTLGGTPRAAALTSADRPEREVVLPLLVLPARRRDDHLRQGLRRPRVRRRCPALGGTILRPRRRDEPGHAPSSHRSDSGPSWVFITCKEYAAALGSLALLGYRRDRADLTV